MTAVESQRGESETLALGGAGEVGKGQRCPWSSGSRADAPTELRGCPDHTEACALPAGSCLCLPPSRSCREIAHQSLLPSLRDLRALPSRSQAPGPAGGTCYPTHWNWRHWLGQRSFSLSTRETRHRQDPPNDSANASRSLVSRHWSPETRPAGQRQNTGKEVLTSVSSRNPSLCRLSTHQEAQPCGWGSAEASGET